MVPATLGDGYKLKRCVGMHGPSGKELYSLWMFRLGVLRYLQHSADLTALQEVPLSTWLETAPWHLLTLQ